MYRIFRTLLLSIILLLNIDTYGQTAISNIYKQLKNINKTTQVQIVNVGIAIKEGNNELASLNSSNIIHFNGQNILIGVNGTGKLYQIDSNFNVNRIDKTEHSGSSFGSADFLFNDTLFSIGGYGFWNTNGAIRYFNPNTNEWDIIKTNINVPFANGINAKSFFDPIDKKIHLIYSKYTPEYISNKVNEYAACYYQCLNLNTKNWLSKPLVIDSKLSSTFSDLTFLQTLPNGIVVNSKKYNSTLFLNFRENKVFTIKDSKYTELIQLKNKAKEAVLFNSDSSFFIYDVVNDQLYPYNISINELSLLPFPIFKSNNLIQYKWTESLSAILLFLSLCFFISFLIYYSKYKKLKKPERNDKVYTIETEKKTVNEFIKNLSEIEKQLLELLVRNNWNNNNTSVTQINKILGTEKKMLKSKII